MGELMFNIGDYIIDENGNVGKVVKINIRSEVEIDCNIINTTEDICIRMILQPSKGIYQSCWIKGTMSLE